MIPSHSNKEYREQIGKVFPRIPRKAKDHACSVNRDRDSPRQHLPICSAHGG